MLHQIANHKWEFIKSQVASYFYKNQFGSTEKVLAISSKNRRHCFPESFLPA